MFENMTYDSILESLLLKVPSNVDKREGSIIFDTLSPAALELAEAYIQLDIMLNNAFADTAEREYLILRAKEIGIEPYEATRAILKLEVMYSGVSENVKIGDRFSIGTLNYTVVEQCVNESNVGIDTFVFDNGVTSENAGYNQPIAGWWKVQCDTYGVVGNSQFGNALPLESIDELVSAKITELLIPGEEEEETEAFRERYFQAVSKNAFGGNRADYIEKVKAIDGVGQVKAYRAPTGGGSVKVVFSDSENKRPSSELINTVKEAIDPSDYEGLGYGLAPIGHAVDVEGVYEKNVSVNASWVVDDGCTVTSSQIESAIEAYFKEVNAEWENKNSLRIYAAQIIGKILDIEGVIDVTDVDINGSQSISAEQDEIFALDTLNE